MQNTYGYVRVSTKEQNEDRQMIAMHDFGVADKNIYIDKMSRKDFNRPAYIALMKRLEPGDTLVLKSIDRLGRDYEEIIDQWRVITKEMQTAIVVLDMPLLDTRAKDKDLTGVFISDLVLQILSYVAQTEREFNHQRQQEGIAAAKTKGVKLGRPPMERPEQFEEMKLAYRQHRVTARSAAVSLGIHHKTFLRWVRD
ncbi:MAG: recombinase family protein [Oscillospiraceae bacterium]|nr:recombinase family protein [Oscillospiraceae bacterium]